jgi:ABC-type bacteriocin/lantibiotic exporter with double-glycine peptidase domain
LPYAVLESVGFLIFLIVFVDWKMTIVVFLLIPMVFVTKAISEKIQDINERINKEKSELNNFFFDSISKLDFIKANDISHAVEKRYSAKNRAIVTIQKLLYRNNILYLMIQFLIENSIKFIVPIYGMYLYSIGDVTPGGIAVCTTIFSSFLVPSTFQLLDMYKDIKAMAPSIHEVYSILSLPEQTNESNVLNVMPLPKDVLVELNNIAFNYNDSVEVIKNLSLALPRTGSVGVCGLSGEGKSTLCKLIANLYMPYEGKITYNSLYFSNKENIRDSIAFVGNEAGFTQDSIYNNISGGGQEIYDAVKAVGMHDFVVNLAKGYETEISENDQNLSGGQRQLLLLARALAKNSPLLILDEPTSSVDQETEKYMIELIDRVSKEKCVLVISHKIETLMGTDMIYVCTQGHLEKLSKSDNVSDVMSNILAERGKYV